MNAYLGRTGLRCYLAEFIAGTDIFLVVGVLVPQRYYLCVSLVLTSIVRDVI